MIFYRSRQNWLPRNLFFVDPGKLVLFICNYTQSACYQSLPRRHPPPLPRHHRPSAFAAGGLPRPWRAPSEVPSFTIGVQ